MAVVLQITMSLDGYAAGADISEDEPLGRDGERLHDWMFRVEDDVHGQIQRHVAETAGAVVVGKRTFDLGVGPWGGVPHPPLPTFVVTHEARDELQTPTGTFTFVTDGVERAIEKAKATAGQKDVILMGGPMVAHQALQAGLVEEVDLHVAHLLLGGGTRLFPELGKAVELQPVRIAERPYATRMRFRVGQGA